MFLLSHSASERAFCVAHAPTSRKKMVFIAPLLHVCLGVERLLAIDRIHAAIERAGAARTGRLHRLHHLPRRHVGSAASTHNCAHRRLLLARAARIARASATRRFVVHALAPRRIRSLQAHWRRVRREVGAIVFARIKALGVEALHSGLLRCTRIALPRHHVRRLHCVQLLGAIQVRSVETQRRSRRHLQRLLVSFFVRAQEKVAAGWLANQCAFLEFSVACKFFFGKWRSLLGKCWFGASRARLRAQ